jgi:hypothetical protein
MTKSGFVVCNDKFIRIKDDQGTINFVPTMVRFREEEVKRAVEQQ